MGHTNSKNSKSQKKIDQLVEEHNFKNTIKYYHHCILCRYTNANEDIVKQHVLENHKVTDENVNKIVKKSYYEYVCMDCETFLKTIRDVKEHVKLHNCNFDVVSRKNAETVKVCSKCDNLEIDKEDIDDHLSTVHSTIDYSYIKDKLAQYRCNTCSKDFFTREDQYKHNYCVHSAKLEITTFCDKNYNRYGGCNLYCTFCNRYLANRYKTMRQSQGTVCHRLDKDRCFILSLN